MKRRSRLHLIDPVGAGPAALRALRMLLEDPDPPFDDSVLILGGSRAERLSASMGVRTTDRIVAPARGAKRALRPLRRYIADRGRPDVAHAWSVETARLAGEACPASACVLSLLRPPEDGATFGRRRAPLQEAPVADVAITPPEIEGAWRALGAGPPALRCVSLPPPVPDPSSMPTRADARARLALRPEQRLVALVGDPAGRLDAFTFGIAATVMYKVGLPIVVLAPPEAFALLRARRWMINHAGSPPLIVDDAPIEALAPAIDLGVWAPRTRRIPSPRGRRRTSLTPVAGASTSGVEIVAACGAAVLGPRTRTSLPIERRLGDRVSLIEARAAVDYAAIGQRLLEQPPATPDQIQRLRESLLASSGAEAWRAACRRAAQTALGLGVDATERFTALAVRSWSQPALSGGS